MGTRMLRRPLPSTVSRADVLVAGAIALIGQLDVWAPNVAMSMPVGPRAVNAVGYLLASVALLWRRRAPVGVLAFVATVTSLQYIVAGGASQGLGSFLPLFVAFYAVGRHAETRALLVAGPLVVLGTAIHELRDPHFEFGGAAVTFWILLAAAWPLGQAFRSRQLHLDELAAKARRLERERDEQARQAVVQERARVARELHDVVGHGVSVIVVQSVAAAVLVEAGNTGQAQQRLTAIEESARQALAEMRRLVGLLDNSDEPQLQPQPSIAALDDLVATVRSAGLPVDMRIVGRPQPLAPGLQLTAYRIVQEALTNALRHAGPAHAHVTIRYGSDALHLEVLDDGVGTTTNGGGGRGLVGMRERALLYGGDLEAGPCEGRGFRVLARLPLDEISA